jgi:serine/threonine protein kinase
VDPTGDGAKDLLQEAAVMAQVGMHPNLISLIGVVTSGTPLLIVLALCENGSLKSQLVERALGEGKLATKRGQLPSKLDADLAVDIAHGMQHLVENNLVHRDLAARNVLLDAALNAKVADFGLYVARTLLFNVETHNISARGCYIGPRACLLM